MKWLEQALPSCTSTVVPGASQALVHDRGVMEEVFAAVQNSLSDVTVSTCQYSIAPKERRGDRVSFISHLTPVFFLEQFEKYRLRRWWRYIFLEMMENPTEMSSRLLLYSRSLDSAG